MGVDRRDAPAPTPAGTVFLQHYDRLVRIAYLVAPPTRRGAPRLAQAHLLVQRTLPWRSGAARTYPQLVARVLRRAARPRRLGLPPLATWARPAPVGGDHQHRTVVAALAAAPAPVRAAYVLLMVERLPAREAVVLLREAGWAEGVAHVAAATALRQRLTEERRIPVERQRQLLADPPADPTVVRLRAPDPGTVRALRVARFGGVSLAVLTVASLVTTSVVGAAPRRAPATVGTWGAPEAAVTVRRVDPAAWAGASEPTLASWPARGTRAGDEELVRRAATAWQGLAAAADAADLDVAAARRPESATRAVAPQRAAAATTRPLVSGGVPVAVGAGAVADPPVGTPQLLYAGELDGATVAVLADPTRIATYVVRGAERGLRIDAAPARDADTASVIRVGPPAGASRYLVAPWVDRIEARTLDGAWRRLPVRGGLSDPVPARTGGCWAGPLLRLRSAAVADSTPFVLADLGGAALTPLRHLPPTVDPARPGADELDPAAGPAVWSRLGCPLGDLHGAAPESVTTWEIWRGRLPRTTGPSRLVCLRAAFPGDGSRVSAVLLGPGPDDAATVATASGTRLCSRLAPGLVVGWWWRSPAGRWHHVAAGSASVRSTEVTVAGRTRHGTRLVVSGPYPDRPTGPVTVRATGRDGKAVPVLG